MLCHPKCFDHRAFSAKARKMSGDLDGGGGAIIEKGDVYLWMASGLTHIVELHVRREPIQLTKRERGIFHSFHNTLEGSLSTDQSRAAQTSLRIASYYAFGNILVAQHLRGHGAANFWSPTIILNEL
jgi:hypothetical protein